MMNRFYSQFIGPGDVCFDVGAHVGNRVRSWLKLGARVIAIEPQPQMLGVLHRWYGDNPNVTILPIGLADQPGQLTLHINTKNPTLTTFSQSWIRGFESNPDIKAAPWDDTEQVAVTTLDQLISDHGVPAFCKIDVEGFEDKVLAGLSTPLPALSFEAFPLQRDRSIQCVERLMALGDYRFRTVRAETFRWVQAGWVDATQIQASISAQSIAIGSVDIYARLQSL